MSSSNNALKLLDIENNLAGEQADAYAKKYDRTLLILKKRAQAALDEGLPQEDFDAATKLIEGVDLARKIIKLTRQQA